MSAVLKPNRFVLVDSATHNPVPRARQAFQWLRPIAFGTRDRALASHVCNCIATTTPRLTFKGVRASLVSAKELA
jgi:hypothetical protein